VNATFQQRSDEDLARQAQAGSLAAFEELVLRYERRIYGFVRQFCPNRADAAEVTQEVFVKAYRNITRYDPRHAFPGWLFTVARHKCIDHHRASPPTADEPVPDRADGSNPADALSSQEERDNLWALARRVLPPLQFQALWLAYAEELKVKEIAGVLSRTSTHVKVMLFRARRTLRSALEQAQPPSIAAEPTAGPPRSAPAPMGFGPKRRGAKGWQAALAPVQVSTTAKLGPIPGR